MLTATTFLETTQQRERRQARDRLSRQRRRLAAADELARLTGCTCYRCQPPRYRRWAA